MLRQIFSVLGKRQAEALDTPRPGVSYEASNVFQFPGTTRNEFRLADGTPLDPDLAKQAVVEVVNAYEERRRLDQERHLIDARVAAMFAADPK